MGEFEKFYNKALKFLSYRPRSEKEIIDKLLSKKATEELISKVVKKLKEYNFVNDKEFIKWWIEQRTNFKPRSLRLIKLELRRKGITSDLIEETIHSPQLKINDLDSAKNLIKKRSYRYKNLSKNNKFQKIARYLSSKGFSYDVIKEVFKELGGN